METKYKIGTLVTLANDKKIYKVVEIWEMGAVAYLTGLIPKENKYGLSCFADFSVRTASESEISPIVAPGTEADHVPVKEEVAEKNKSKKS